MLAYPDNILSFANALDHGQWVSLSKEGEWNNSSSIYQRIRYLIFGESGYYRDLTSLLLAQMDAFERSAFAVNGTIDENQKSKVEAFARASDRLKAKLGRHKSTENELVGLLRRVTALNYRAERAYGGWDKSSGDRNTYEQLESLLTLWKQQRLYYSDEQKELNERDKRVLNEICQYPEFAALILRNHTLMDDLFNWSIKDNNQVQIFVEFPAISERIRSCYLASRVGRFADKILQVEKEKNKTVTLRFQVEESNRLTSRKFSLLDESQILTMRGGGKWTIREIFGHFAKKNEKIGDFEVFGGDESKMEDRGILCWNAHELGYHHLGDYVRINLELPDWWKELPVFEMIEAKELEKRTGLNLQNKPWGVAMAKGTRKYPQLDVDKSHGFIGLAILQEDGRYRIYDFGKFAAKFPATNLEYLFFLTNTVISKIEYPDTNNFYSDRQTAVHAKAMDEGQGRTLFNLVARDLKRAREGKLIFQFGWENCAYWPQQLFTEVFGKIENLYRMYILEAEMSQWVLRAMVSVGTSLPKKWQDRFVTFILQTLDYKQGVIIDGVKKCLYNTPLVQGNSEERHHIFCASHLHKVIREKKVPGILYGGHQ